MSRYITVAIHTYEKAIALRRQLENEGIAVELNNVNLEVPGFSSGVRVRIPETDLPLALRIIENGELFVSDSGTDKGHTILVPVDLSENSYKAACLAANIAASQGARLHFLYSYIDPYIAGKVQFTDTITYDVGDRGAREQMVQNAGQLLDNFLCRLRNDMKKGAVPVVSYGQTVTEGVPEDAISEFAKSSPPYLIVMGTRAADQKDKEMIGSVTAEVLDEGHFTVLTLPEPVELTKALKPQNVLFLSNLDQNDILAIDTLYRLFGGEGTHVNIVHIPKKKRFSDMSADKALRALSDYCRNNFAHYHFETVPVNQAESEREFVRLNEITPFDLVVVPNRRRNAFSRLFNPGIAHRILFRTDIPMLIIPV